MAANKQKGEFPLTVGDRDFVLVLDFDAMELIEERLSTPHRVVTAHEAVFEVISRTFPPFKHSRAVLWAALQRKHPEMTLAKVAELIEEMGGTEHVVAAILGMYKAAKPDAEDLEGRPREARQDSTGGPITSTPGASA